MDWILTVLVGLVVGWMASVIMRVNGKISVLATVVVGVLGAVLGRAFGMSMGLITERTDQVASWVVAVAGAAVLIAVVEAFTDFGQPKS